jgi:hypothetical protein
MAPAVVSVSDAVELLPLADAPGIVESIPLGGVDVRSR